VVARQAKAQDAARPGAVARRRKTGQRTVRENIAELCDEGSFAEYGSLVIAARRQRNTVEELIDTTPADGLVMGVGRVNGHLFPDKDARCVVMSYDYTVLAGTQGKKNHQKKDRMFRLAERARLPIVFFTEGGGGRPGDTDQVFAGNLHTPAFHLFGRLSGLVPLVGITSGRCFAGNAVILGCCDVVIATANSNIGMGGPAMIEGGGLGVFRPDSQGGTVRARRERQHGHPLVYRPRCDGRSWRGHAARRPARVLRSPGHAPGARTRGLAMLSRFREQSLMLGSMDRPIPGGAPAAPAEPDPVVEAYKQHVDRSLIRESLRRSVEERLERLIELQRFAAELRRATVDASRR
jgi:hypothetical protein